MPLSLFFAAMRGDNVLMHKLLKQGKDPNELDSTGRTPLVCNFLYLIMHSHEIHMQGRCLSVSEAEGDFYFVYVTAYCSIQRILGMCGSTPRLWSKS